MCPDTLFLSVCHYLVHRRLCHGASSTIKSLAHICRPLTQTHSWCNMLSGVRMPEGDRKDAWCPTVCSCAATFFSPLHQLCAVSYHVCPLWTSTHNQSQSRCQRGGSEIMSTAFFRTQTSQFLYIFYSVVRYRGFCLSEPFVTCTKEEKKNAWTWPR